MTESRFPQILKLFHSESKVRPAAKKLYESRGFPQGEFCLEADIGVEQRQNFGHFKLWFRYLGKPGVLVGL